MTALQTIASDNVDLFTAISFGMSACFFAAALVIQFDIHRIWRSWRWRHSQFPMGVDPKGLVGRASL